MGNKGGIKNHVHAPYVYRLDGEGKHYKCSICKKIIVLDWLVVEVKK